MPRQDDEILLPTANLKLALWDQQGDGMVGANPMRGLSSDGIASGLSMVGDPVGRWFAYRGSVEGSQVTSGYRPTRQANGLQLGTNRRLNVAPGVVNGAFTVYAVGVAPTAGDLCLCGSTIPWSFLSPKRGNKVAGSTETALTGEVPYAGPLDTPALFRFRRTSSNAVFFDTAGQSSSLNTAAGPFDIEQIGSRVKGLEWSHPDGRISLFLFYWTDTIADGTDYAIRRWIAAQPSLGVSL